MSNLSSDLAITPKRLGLTALPDFCARCFWYLLHLKFHPPFNGFAGAIFDRMEQAQLAIVSDLLDQDGKLPDEFEPFCDLVGCVEFPRDYRKYRFTLKSGATLYGEPDAIYQRADKSLVVVDHKSADHKDGTDRFLPCYQIQTVGYGLIAEKGLNLGKVSEGGLFYWSASHDAVVADPGKHYRSKMLWMPFLPKPIGVEMDFSTLDEPLKEAARLWTLRAAPEGQQGCKDCRRLDAFLALEEEAQSVMSSSDRQMLASSGNSSWVFNRIQHRRWTQSQRRQDALLELRDKASEIKFADDGLIANW
jgi:hypothetical protein